ARPKLATPTIYQHARSPANDHSSLGLGETTPPTTTRAGFRAESRNRRSTTRQSDASWNVDGSGSWAQDGDRGAGGFSGRIQAWGKDEGHQHDEQPRECYEDWGEPEEDEQSQEQDRHGDREIDAPHFVDNPA
ncbi:unnamed protein product, partial [Ectocarpus fasciculatus]